MIAPRKLATELLVLAAIALVLAAIGPFGSFGQPLGSRLLHWALYLIAGYVFFRPVIAAGGALSHQTGLNRAVAIAIACALATFPTSVVLVLLSAGTKWHMVSVGTLIGSYLQTLIIGATVTVVQVLAGARRQSEVAISKAPVGSSAEQPTRTPVEVAPLAQENTPPGFVDLLPPHLGDDIVCLENEDHYVRVHTRNGSALILMRMRDAVAQLEDRGERVHRSWWVARDAVVATVRQDRNLKLRLIDGREVPVARANVAALRAQGWLAETPNSADVR